MSDAKETSKLATSVKLAREIDDHSRLKSHSGHLFVSHLFVSDIDIDVTGLLE